MLLIGMSGYRVVTLLALLCSLRGALSSDDESDYIFEIKLDVGNYSTNRSLKHYKDDSWFTSRYANIPTKIVGSLRQPVPRDACHHIELLNTNDTNDTWIALVGDYPSCGEDMVTFVRNAGYKAIITASVNNSERNVFRSLRNTNFPIVVVSADYASHLQDLLSHLPNDTLSVRITTDDVTAVAVITLCCAFFITCCCCTGLCTCFICCSCRTTDPVERRLEQLEQRRRDLEQQQRHDRLARQELIQSILRQLQELQLDIRHQTPLGQAETERLPKRPYQPGRDTCETCAICVDDFTAEDIVRVLPCSHVFHPQCIDEWLTSHSSLCPLCKMELPRQQDEGRQEGDSSDSEDLSSSGLTSDSPLLPRRNQNSQRSALHPVYGSV